MFDFLKKKDESGDSPVVSKFEDSVFDTRKFVTLIILDGFGVFPDAEGNAVWAAKTPFLDTAWTFGRSTLIHAAGTHVGLPNEEPGNSEVGHLNLGAGQVVYQSLPRINDAISGQELNKNGVVREMFDQLRSKKSDLHLTGVLSAAGVHGHIKHLFSLMELCKANGVDPYIHIMLDGRDTGPMEGYLYISKLKEKIKELGVGRIASMMGRFYGMDRDSRWERTKLAYDAMVGISDDTFTDPVDAIQQAYKREEFDQFFKPRVCVGSDGKPVGVVKDNDAVLFWNFREDRARQLTKVFVLEDFTHFQRVNYPKNICFVTMTGYEEGLPSKVIFPPLAIGRSLAEYLSAHGKRQVHLTETEKFMHVTYFFNGGIEQPHPGETFFNIPSPRVDDYALTPAMSAEIIRDETVRRIEDIQTHPFEFILLNFANPDMLGHTGNFNATVRGNEITDTCCADIAKATLNAGGAVVITADHGNCETMINRVTKQVDIAHTNNPVPLTVLTNISEMEGKAGIPLKKIGTGEKARTTGLLADVAPTVLGLLGMDIPANMTGVDLRSVI
ncbi:MAG: 2,3-bisphosphoglycerate-independent phosphoglycerate mutase [Candidatus Dojkabacteria bacterium]|jgi:2,3-bisphosphoglycerate-independent phosphoglycerate mutase